MSNKLFDLSGKTALVTGGTHGIGMAMAVGLAGAGAAIVINGRSADKLDAAREAYAEKGIRAHTYRFDVTVEHADTGWEHYADGWEVVAPDGTVLGTRTLLHPHVDEQPFTRSLSGVAIPDGNTEVTIRAHDSVDGLGGKEVRVELPAP